MTDDRYDKVTFHGKTVDKWTRAALLEAEKRLGYELTIVQGSYHGGVGASAGTHDGGGAVDLAPYDWQRKVKVLRELGFAAWHRLPSEGPWGEHIHAIQVGNDKASPAAQRQVTAYRNGRNGLANNAVDNTWRPDPIPVFKYDPTPEPVTKPLKVVGADFAHHFKGNIPWQLARNNGVRFIVHKVTEGATVVDPAYRARRAEGDAFNAGLSKVGKILGRGVRQGGYHYASPDGPKVDDAEREADWFLKHLIVGDYDVAPWLDFEELNGLTLAQADRWCVKWIARVRAAGIKRVGLYTNFDLPDAAESADFVVRARYSNANAEPIFTEGPNAGEPAPYDVRQFSNGVYGVPRSVPGFGTGTVDLNALRKGFRFRKLKMRAKTQQTPDPEPTPDPTPEPPKVAGHWNRATANLGNGTPRQVVDGLAVLATKADVITCQEAGDRGTEVTEFVMNQAGVWAERSRSAPGAPSLRVLFNVLAANYVSMKWHPVGSDKGTRLVPVGKPKPKDLEVSRVKPKGVMEVRWVHKASGVKVCELNAHFPSSVGQSKAKLGEYAYGRLRALAREYVAEIEKAAAAAEADGCVVRIGGDFQLKPSHPLLKALSAIATNLVTKPSFPAKKPRRIIDHIRVLPSKHAVNKGVEMVELDGWDHVVPVHSMDVRP